jgi:hypothetical protein
MRPEEVTLESISIEGRRGHRDQAVYDTVCFRIFPPDHPNSFVVPISVNTGQYGKDEVERQARFVFHRILRSLAEATQEWDRLDQRPT